MQMKRPMVCQDRLGTSRRKLDRRVAYSLAWSGPGDRSVIALPRNGRLFSAPIFLWATMTNLPNSARKKHTKQKIERKKRNPFFAQGSTKSWTNASMVSKMAGRGVFVASIPAAAMAADVEWYVSAGALVWPAAAPAVPHTVVVV